MLKLSQKKEDFDNFEDLEVEDSNDDDSEYVVNESLQKKRARKEKRKHSKALIQINLNNPSSHQPPATPHSQPYGLP